MGGLSIWHWLILIIGMTPMFMIVAKAGFSPLWTLLMFVPIVNIVALWVFAFIRWPAIQSAASTFE